MKTTTWLCPVLTLLCATKLVYTAQRGSYGGYPLGDMDSNMLQNDYFLSKRNKPSLSIVNPLDVLRQRLLLEIARRQMKENTRQVELNRAILKNVGKRVLNKHPYPLAATFFDVHESQQQQQRQQQLQQEQAMQQQRPYEMELIPTTLIFDYLQQQQQRRPWMPYESTGAAVAAMQFDRNSNNVNDAIDDIEDGDDDEDDNDENGENNHIATNDIFGNNDKHSMMMMKQHLKQSNNDHLTSALTNNPTTHDISNIFKKSNNRNNDTKRLTLLNHHTNELNDENHHLPQIANDNNSNSNNNNNNVVDGGDDNENTDYQVQRYLYHLHKNHLTRK